MDIVMETEKTIPVLKQYISDDSSSQMYPCSSSTHYLLVYIDSFSHFS